MKYAYFDPNHRNVLGWIDTEAQSGDLPDAALLRELTEEEWELSGSPIWVGEDGSLVDVPPPGTGYRLVSKKWQADTAYQAETARGQIAARRFQAEKAGISVSGMAVATDRDSQALITGAALAASLDDTYTCNWKTGETFVLLDSKTLLAIAKTVRAHVQACFDREAELLAAVKAGKYNDAMLEEGWPA